MVSVTCVHDSFAACPEGEVPWGGSCYSVHFDRLGFHEAQAACRREGKRLVEVTTREENDLLSELLLRNRYSPGLLAQMWTGGMGSHAARAPFYYWHGSRTAIDVGKVNIAIDNLYNMFLFSHLFSAAFRQWWPGWNGERKGRKPAELGRPGDAPLGIKLSRRFDFVARNRGSREERLVDYYFWQLEDLRTRLAFVCERGQKDIGCVAGDGRGYRGNATRGESGDECVPWDTPELAFVLDEADIANLGDLEGNNYCRNPGMCVYINRKLTYVLHFPESFPKKDGDSAPWCIAPNGEFDYCDIPQCPAEAEVADPPKFDPSEVSFSTAKESDKSGDSVGGVDLAVSASAGRCGSDQFQCRAGECVLSAYVCDGHRDCANGRDEGGCDGRELDRYVKRAGTRLASPYAERWLDSSARACAVHCRNARGFVCRSFNYHAGKRLCTLSEDNVGTAGRLEGDRQWDHYELRSQRVTCNETLRCPSGKCLEDGARLCDGKDDCGDKHDERDCDARPNVRLRLAGGRANNEGRVEIAAFHYGWGGICDDGFGIEEANVLCRQLGFSLGAREAAINSRFGSGGPRILLDELDCDGSESDVLDCRFDPWTKHDCSAKEWAGVVCKTKEEGCHHDEVIKERQCE